MFGVPIENPGNPCNDVTNLPFTRLSPMMLRSLWLAPIEAQFQRAGRARPDEHGNYLSGSPCAVPRRGTPFKRGVNEGELRNLSNSFNP